MLAHKRKDFRSITQKISHSQVLEPRQFAFRSLPGLTTSIDFFASIAGGTLVVRLTLPSKILTPYGDTEKNFRFLKEAKILSNFVIVPLHA